MCQSLILKKIITSLISSIPGFLMLCYCWQLLMQWLWTYIRTPIWLHQIFTS